MDTDLTSTHNLRRNVLTVRQQVNNLKALLQERQHRLSQEKEIGFHEIQHGVDRITELEVTKCDADSPDLGTDLESVKIINVHEDFQSLLNEKLATETEIDRQCNDNTVKQKRPFLKKGEGLTRFRMKPGDFTFKKRRSTGCDNRKDSNSKQKENDAVILNTSNKKQMHKDKSSPLKAFENLEQRMNDSSFCSTSSVIAQLMEDSMKSTPVKNTDHVELSETNFVGRNLYPTNYEFIGHRNLDIIDEEPSRLEYTQNDDLSSNQGVDNRNCNLIMKPSSDHSSENSFSDDGSHTSDCSCSCQDTTNYLSTSVSLFAEETSVYSPVKGGSSRTIRCARIDQALYNVKGCPNISVETNPAEEELKNSLEARMFDLEAEIEAFKIENSHLTRLRSDYEKEYNEFCEERMKVLAQIREERLKGVKELEEDKKKLRMEKLAFEKHMRDRKNRPNKQEKEEIRLLKEEIALLKEDMNKKECRWAAAQARIRTEMKLIKDHNTTLQEELKELKKSAKKVTFAPTMKKSKSSPNINQKSKKESPKSPVNKSLSPLPQFNDVNSTSDLGNSSLDDAHCVSRIQTFPENSRSFDNDYSSIPDDLRRTICVSSYLSEDQGDENSSIFSRESGDAEIQETTDLSGDREKLYPDGRKEIWHANGSVKKISPDGQVIKNIYYNGDVEEILVGKQVKYYHASTKTWHTTFCDGRDMKELTEFPNGQVEKHFTDGSEEITSPDGTVRTTSPFGEKKWLFVDGTVVIENEKGEKRTIFPNGEIEIYTTEFKRRNYPNGTTKTVYTCDGRQETRYANGRIRVKDRNGNLISDTEIT